MILKTKQLTRTTTPQAIAGQKQEQDVAFFLRRAYKDNPQVLVINDFKFTFNDETAQIDHLIIYTYGFVLIESKSIKGHVKVNKQGEWTRSYSGRSTTKTNSSHWQGMPSPIKQVELQQALLKELLKHHRSDMLGKLLGIKQQGFGMRCWDHLCAISSDAVIDRKNIPSDVSNKLAKSEFLVEKLDKLMNLKNRFMRVVNFSDSRPDFSLKDLNAIGSFLLAQHIDSQCKASQPIVSEHHQAEPVAKSTDYKAVPAPSDPQQIAVPTAIYQSVPTKAAVNKEYKEKISCKHCGESNNYTPMYGKFGYYIRCEVCTKNTPMKQPCPQCESKNTKVQKRKELYTLNCLECGCARKIVSG